jgi:hypothetical protein
MILKFQFGYKIGFCFKSYQMIKTCGFFLDGVGQFPEPQSSS